MKKLAYLLTSAAASVVALASSDSNAKTIDPELDTVIPPSQATPRVGRIPVSESARTQLLTMALRGPIRLARWAEVYDPNEGNNPPTKTNKKKTIDLKTPKTIDLKTTTKTPIITPGPELKTLTPPKELPRKP
jgi:hypothetical protein